MSNLSGDPANWFYVLDSRRHGPFDRVSLVRELLSLEAPEGVLVWRTGLLTWTKAGTLDDLKRELPPPLPGALPAEEASSSPLPPPHLPENGESGKGAPDADEATDSVPGGDLVVGADEGDPEGQSAAEKRRRRRRHRSLRTAGLPSYLMPLVLLFLALMLGLWFLLRRLNEVPPGRIIQQGDLGAGSRALEGLRRVRVALVASGFRKER